MEFVATYWWIWLVGMILCYGYAIYNQVQRMKRSMTEGSKIDSFTDGLFSMFLAGLSGSVFGLVLLLSVILNIIAYTKQ